MAPRPGTKHAAKLFKETNVEVWATALRNYGRAVVAKAETLSDVKKKDILVENDSWWTSRFPDTIQKRGFVTKEEIVRVMEWKLSVGKWRPLLNRLTQQNTPDSIETVSKEAFTNAKKGSVKDAVMSLSKLSAGGPATASALLAAFMPERFAFMADETLEAILGKREYTLKAYLHYNETLQSHASELEMCVEDGRRAMWACAVLGFDVATSEQEFVQSTKRKRNEIPKNGKRKKYN